MAFGNGQVATATTAQQTPPPHTSSSSSSSLLLPLSLLSSSSSSSTSPPSLGWMESFSSPRLLEGAKTSQDQLPRVPRRVADTHRVFRGSYKLRREDTGEIIEIDQTPFVVGRGHECNLRIKHVNVSSKHCILHFFSQFDDVFIEDCSSNGTFVNGERVDSFSILPRQAKIEITRQHVYVLESIPPKQPSQEIEQESYTVSSKQSPSKPHLRLFDGEPVSSVSSPALKHHPPVVKDPSKLSATKKKRTSKDKSKRLPLSPPAQEPLNALGQLPIGRK
eukprot:685730-Hanusia_phi.AAC.1